jgi:hypothetical protein
MMLESLVQLNVDEPASVAATGEDRIAYVAHRDGLVRLDLQARTAVPVTAPAGIVLTGLERILWDRGAVIAIEAAPDGSRRVIRFQLNRTGRAVTEATVIDAFSPSTAGPTFATIAGDELYYLVTRMVDAGRTDVSVRRIRLR